MDACCRPDTSGRTPRSMPRLFALLCVMAVLAGLRAVGDASAEPALQATPEEARAAFIAAIDRSRAAAGLPAYTVHPLLDELAQSHADYLISTGRFSHFDARGRSARARILAAGFPGHRAGENYVSRKNAELAVRWLLDDPPHRNNVLHTFYNAHGVGVARTRWGDWLFVQDLGNDPNAAAVAAAADSANGSSDPADAPPDDSAPQASAAAGGEGEPNEEQARDAAGATEAAEGTVEGTVDGGVAGADDLGAASNADGHAEAMAPATSEIGPAADSLGVEGAELAPVESAVVAAAAPLIESPPVDVAAAAAPVIDAAAHGAVGDGATSGATVPEPAVIAALSPPYGFRVPRADGRGMDVPAFEPGAALAPGAEDLTPPTDSAIAPPLLSGSAVWPLGPAPVSGWLIPLLSAVVVILVITRFSGRP